MKIIFYLIIGSLSIVATAWADQGTFFGIYVCDPMKDKLTLSSKLLSGDEANNFPIKNTDSEVVYSADELVLNNNDVLKFKTIQKDCTLSTGTYRVFLGSDYDSFGGYAWPAIQIFKGKKQLFHTDKYEFIQMGKDVELSGDTGEIRIVP